MLSFSNKPKGGSKGAGKELQKLKRRDLLELLVEQLHEGDRLELELSRREASIVELTGLSDRLKDKLDAKDEQIERLTARLDEKDQILWSVFESLGKLTTADRTAFEGELHKLEQLVTVHYLGQFGHRDEAEAEGEPEAELEPEVEPELELEPEASLESEPELDDEADR